LLYSKPLRGLLILFCHQFLHHSEWKRSPRPRLFYSLSQVNRSKNGKNIEAATVQIIQARSDYNVYGRTGKRLVTFSWPNSRSRATYGF